MGIIEAPSPYVLGIDLGTSNSAIAVKIGEEVQIIPIDGSKTCPSVMHVEENGGILVGRHAKKKMIVDPENTVASIKRELGGGWTKEFAGLPGKVYTPTDISAEILTKLVHGAGEAGTIDLKGVPRTVVITV